MKAIKLRLVARMLKVDPTTVIIWNKKGLVKLEKHDGIHWVMSTAELTRVIAAGKRIHKRVHKKGG